MAEFLWLPIKGTHLNKNVWYDRTGQYRVHAHDQMCTHLHTHTHSHTLKNPVLYPIHNRDVTCA